VELGASKAHGGSRELVNGVFITLGFSLFSHGDGPSIGGVDGENADQR
jgi:hypothetical protein